MAKRKTARRKKAVARKSARRTSVAVARSTSNDSQVIKAAKRLLADAMKVVQSGMRSTGGLGQRTFAQATVAPKAVKKTSGSANLRGRTAGFYFPAVKKVDANETVTKIFAYITKNRKTGTTQKQIQDGFKLPHSTVWYALVKLRDLKAVKYQAAPAAKAA
jgi:hypothetical protein